MCSSTWFGIFGSSFPKLPQYPSTCETGIAQPTEGNGTTVRSHLMWNKKLETLDYFSVVPAKVFGPSFSKLPQYRSTCETDIAQPTEDNSTILRSHLMWNKELKTLGYFSGVPCTWFGIFRPSLPKLLTCDYLWNRYNSTHIGPRH